jgi:hypothetical protein
MPEHRTPEFYARLRAAANIASDAVVVCIHEHKHDNSHFDKDQGFVGRYLADWYIPRTVSTGPVWDLQPGFEYDPQPSTEYDIDGVKVLVTQWIAR